MKVFSGGQTGVDIAALRAAKRAGFETGGWAPKGWLTEAGPMPSLAEFGLRECDDDGYAVRTARNVRDSDATLIIGNTKSPGSRLTHDLCISMGRPVTMGNINRMTPADVLEFISLPPSPIRPSGILNVAGNRESRAPGIGKAAEEWLYKLFCIIKGKL